MTDVLDIARDALEDALDAEVYQGPKVRAVFAALRAVLAEHERLTAPPTDAEILAGLNAELLPAHRAPDLSFYAQANIDRMRAVLEAARGVIA